MKQKEKNKLRRLLFKKLRSLPEGKMIRIDNDALQELLFDEIVLRKSKHDFPTIVKLPVWSGRFLRKLDLSQVDFTDVSWEILSNGDVDEFEISNRTRQRLKELSQKHPRVDYSYTNAHIDLSRSFESRTGCYISISGCDFSSIDLDTDIEGNNQLIIYNSNISKTGLVIPRNIELSCMYSNLSDINLSNRAVDGYENCMNRDGKNLYGCDLYNTGIRIDLDMTKFKQTSSMKKLVNSVEEKWRGCNLNAMGKMPIEEEETQKNYK